MGKNPITALQQLDEIRKELWSTADDKIKFRILTNIAAAKLEMNQEREAGQLFIEAFKYSEKDEKAMCNLALGHILIKDKLEARKIIQKAIKKFPKSSRAYSILAQSFEADKGVSEIITLIPKGLLETKDVSYSLGILFINNDDLENANKWLETANNNEESEAVIKAALAETKLKIALRDPELIIAGQLTDDSRNFIEKSIALFSEAWKMIKDAEISRYKSIWLVNRCLANRMLGRVDEAIRDIETALEFDSKNPEYIKQKVMILHGRGSNKEAVALLKSIINLKENPEVSVMVAGFLLEMRQYEDAEKVLLELIGSASKNSRIVDDAKGLLVKFYIESERLEDAEKLTDGMLKDNPQSIPYLIGSARVNIAKGESNRAILTLRGAKNQITDRTPKREILELADQFYSMDCFEEASDIYVKFVDISIYSSLLTKLINSYYRTRKLGEALKICQGLFEKYGALKFVSEIESAIYEEIGDLKNAKKVIEAYVEKFPEDLHMKVRLAIVNYRRNDLVEVDKFLKGKIDIKIFDLFSLMQVVNLLEVRGQNKKALEVMYEITRKYGNKEEANINYIGLFFRREKENDKYLNRDKVEIDSAVLLEDATGQTRWYILEDRADSNLSQGEINKDHDFFGVLLGKKVGDTFILREGQLGEEKLKVKEIKSKFVYLLHQLMTNFSKNFPSANGLQSIHVDGKSINVQDGERPEWIDKMFNQITKINERRLMVEKFYKEGKSTIGAVSEFMGQDIFKTWGFLLSKPDIGIKASIGTKEERATSMLEFKKGRKLIVDLISIFTIHELDIADNVVENYGRLGVSQSTIDVIQEIIFERKGIESKGYMTIGKDGDQYVREEISADKIKKNREYLERILDWIEANCDVVPCMVSLSLNQKKKEVSKMIGKSFFDTILISSEDGNILYSDDERLRSLANSEYGVVGVWTQIILMDLLAKRSLDEDDYARYVVRLVDLNYYYTSINKNAILEAAKSSTWEYKGSLFTMFQRLKGNYSDEDSSIRVVGEFLHMAWINRLIPEEKKETLLFQVLDVLIENREKEKVLTKFISSVRDQFKNDSFEKEEMLTLTRKWKSKK